MKHSGSFFIEETFSIDLSVLPISSDFEKGKHVWCLYHCSCERKHYSVDADKVRGALRVHLEYSSLLPAASLQFYSWGLFQSKYLIDRLG